MKYKTKTVRFEQIEVEPRAQTRAGELDNDHIDQMIEDLDDLPPMKCVMVGERFLLADGFHRYAAYRKRRMIRVDVLASTGTEDDWIDAFAKANDDQKGKPRTRADKRASVLRVVEMRPNWSNVRIAEAAGVSDEFVRKLRPSVSNVGKAQDGKPIETSEKREGKDGRMFNATKPKPPVYRDPEDIEDPVYDSGEPVVYKDRGEDDYDDSEPEAQIPSAPAPEPISEAEPEPEAVGDPVQVDTTDESDPQQTMVDELSQLCYQLDKIKKRVAELQQMPHGKFIHVQSIASNLQSARGTMWANRPTHKCPACAKSGRLSTECKHCNGLDISTVDHAKLMRN
jgi:hypothetical protein